MPPGATVPGSAPIKETHMSTSTLTRPVEHVDGYLIVPTADGTWWEVFTEDYAPVGGANRHDMVDLVIDLDQR